MKVLSQVFDHQNVSAWQGNTTFQPIADIKLPIVLGDGKIVQAAGFKIRRPNQDVEFHACISTQAGCKFSCQMCVSGREGYGRNLTAKEICNQVEAIAAGFGVENLDRVVFMGVGEPLDNYNEFAAAVRELNDRGYQRKLSFATVGLPEKIRQFANEQISVRMLWLSIHAPNDMKRQEILPVAKNFTLQEVLDAGIYFAERTSAEVRVNYLLYRGFNDSAVDAQELAGLLSGTEARLTLQLTQPNDVPFKGYGFGDGSDIARFQEYLAHCGLKNRIIRFLAAGRPLRAGCGEFEYIP